MYKKIILAISLCIQMTTVVIASSSAEEPDDFFGAFLQLTEDVYLDQGKITAKLDKLYELEHGHKNKLESAKKEYIDYGFKAVRYLKKHENLKIHAQRVRELTIKMMRATPEDQKVLLDAYDQDEAKNPMSLKTRGLFNQFYRKMVLLDFEEPIKEDSIKPSSSCGNPQRSSKNLVASIPVQKYSKKF